MSHQVVSRISNLFTGTEDQEEGLNDSGNELNLLEGVKDKFEDLLLDNDLLFALTYMTSLSTAQLSRNYIFHMVAENREYAASKYFRKIRDLTQKWHYDYATACELIANRVKHERTKNLLSRFANAISAGEPDVEFLRREHNAFKTIRRNEYERGLDNMNKWADAYTSILVSTSLITVIIFFSIAIYSASNPISLLLGGTVLNMAICSFGIGMLFKTVPKDRKIHDFHIKPKEQVIISRLKLFLIPLAVLTFIMLSVIPAFFNTEPIMGVVDIKGLGFIMSGAILSPIALLGRIDDRKVSSRDESFTSFIKSLGSVKASGDVSLAEAINNINKKNLGDLSDLALQLKNRLSMGVSAKLCWDRFIGESGSYLVKKFTSIFVDAMDMGGDSSYIGEEVGSSALGMVLLRLKRDLISSGFTNLIITLHIAMVALLLFVSKILNIFTLYISELFTKYVGGAPSDVASRVPMDLGGMSIGVFGNVPMDLIQQFTFFVILTLTIANALAANIVKGGGWYMYIYFACILFVITGLLMIIIPNAIDLAFSLPSFTEMGDAGTIGNIESINK